MVAVPAKNATNMSCVEHVWGQLRYVCTRVHVLRFVHACLPSPKAHVRNHALASLQAPIPEKSEMEIHELQNEVRACEHGYTSQKI